MEGGLVRGEEDSHRLRHGSRSCWVTKVSAVKRIASIVLAAVLLAGCGATRTTPGQSSKVGATGRAGGSKFYLPVAAAPTTCTVYLHGRDAAVQFASQALDVVPACQSWIRANAKDGTLWTGQAPTYGLPFDDAQVCSLANARDDVTVSVVDDGSRASGHGACERLIAAGWVEQTPATGKTTRNSRPATGAPRLIVGRWSGTEPSQIDFSADGGNIVTGLLWSAWTETQAVGHGTSDIQSCVPNCAEGADRPVSTTITLTDPRGGHFTEMTENRNGLTSDYAYGSPRTWPGYGA